MNATMHLTLGGRRSGVSRRATALLGCLLALFFCRAGSAQAQEPSTDRDSPTPLAANEIRGEGPGRDTTYYYSFAAGRGELKVTLDVTATGETAATGGAELEIFDDDSRQLLKMFLYTGHGENKRDVRRVAIRGSQPQQTLFLKLKVEGGNDKYLVRLEGPAAPAGGGAVSGTAVSPKTSPGERMCLPAAGTLVMQTSSGEAYEIDLSQIIKASVKP